MAQAQQQKQPQSADVYTIDGSAEEYESLERALFAAALKVFEKRRSIVVYKNGKEITLRRY